MSGQNEEMLRQLDEKEELLKLKEQELEGLRIRMAVFGENKVDAQEDTLKVVKEEEEEEEGQSKLELNAKI